MKLTEAHSLFDKHRNLNGHIILDGTVLISKIFIAPTEKKEYDSAMFYLFNHHLAMSNEYTKTLSSKDVDVFVLYYAKSNNSPVVMSLNRFIEEIIPAQELYNNILN